MSTAKTKIFTVLVATFLVGTIITPTMAIALTKDSHAISTVESNNDLTTDSLNQLTTDSSIEPSEGAEELSPEPTIEELTMEENYEDLILADTLDSVSPHPIVQLDEKELVDTLKIKGKLTIGSKKNAQQIRLRKVAIQVKEIEADWVEQRDFEIAESFDFSEEGFTFDYEKQIEKAQEIRLIVDYELTDNSDDTIATVEKHKGSYPIGETSQSEREIEPVVEEEAPNYAIAPRGIQPRGANVIYGDSNAANGSLAGNNYVGHYYIFYSIASRTAKLNYQSNRSMVSTVDTRDFYFVWGTSSDYNVRNADATNSVKATRYDINYSGNSSKWIYFRNVSLTNLLPSTIYYVWICYKGSTGSFAKASSPSNFDMKADMKFTTDGPVALGITTPQFTQTSALATSIPMVGKTYTGDPFQTNTQGKVQVTSNDGTTIQDKVTNLGHTKTQGGTYNNATVSGLAAGTRYKGRVAIKDYVGTWKYSGWSGYFYTPNTANQPAAPTLNNPTASNNATAAVSASYVAGNVAAHPTATEVQISTNNSNWTTINTGSTPAATNPGINTGTKVVTFTLSKLNAKTKYFVRYRVKNASNVWSVYSTSREFTTKGIALTVNTPTFNQSSATATTISMNSGRYTGDISQTTNDGIVYTESYNNGGVKDWIAKISNLVHQTSTGGTYNSATITGLNPGTRYRGWVSLKDYGGTFLTSSASQYFYTANAVNQPAVPTLNSPTLSNNATASFIADYQAGGQNAAQVAGHPTSVEVQYSTNNANWITINTGTTPAVSTPTIDQATKKVSFVLSKLNTKTKYYVRYRVHTQGVVWSSYSASREFTTKGIQPELSPPIFSQSTATPTSIYMESGTYTGDLGTTANHGIIQTESYNAGAEKDWTARVTNLAHDATFKTYAGSWVNGLNPGTRYRGWVAFKDFGTDGTNGSYSYKERTNSNGDSHYFYTTNSIDNLTEPVKSMPTTANNATATFTAGYQAAGQHIAQVAAHPTTVKVFISTDGSSFDEITTSSSGPRLSRNDEVNSSAKTVTFKLEGLRENTRYYVKYLVVNQGGKSPESAPYDFITLGRPSGLYLNEAPSHFNFGVVNRSNNQLSHALHDSVGETLIDFENINTSTQWTLSAKLSELKVDGEAHLKLTGSSILLNKQLTKTSDNGNSWYNVDASKFDSGIGTSGSVVLPADDSTSVTLFKTTDITYGQGHLRNIIPLSSVRLIVPANTGEKGKAYIGKITWTLDTTL